MTHLCVWHPTSGICIRDIIHWACVPMCATWPILMCDVTHLCVPSGICICDIIIRHLYLWYHHQAFVFVISHCLHARAFETHSICVCVCAYCMCVCVCVLQCVAVCCSVLQWDLRLMACHVNGCVVLQTRFQMLIHAYQSVLSHVCMRHTTHMMMHAPHHTHHHTHHTSWFTSHTNHISWATSHICVWRA